MNKYIDFDNNKILVEKKDYSRAIDFYQSKGYWFPEDFLEWANQRNKVFFISHAINQQKMRIFLCRDDIDCEICENRIKVYTNKCKKLKIVLFDSREEKLKRILG